MGFITWALYVIAFGSWFLLIRREGGIGIGIRALFGLNLTLFFLVGPLLSEWSNRQIGLSTYESATQLSLTALLAYLAGAYCLHPLFTGGSVIPANLGQMLAEKARLDAQKRVALLLALIGFICLPFFQLSLSVPTFRAVFSQTPALIDTAMVMLALNAVHGRRSGSLQLLAVVFFFRNGLFVAMSGHAGFIWLNGLFLCIILFFSKGIRIHRLIVLLLLGVIAFVPASHWLMGRDRLRDVVWNDNVTFEEKLLITSGIFLAPDAQTGGNASLIDAYIGRGDFSELFAAALHHTPKYEPYAIGESYWEIFAAIVPRFLWADKPIVAGGNRFVSRYTGVQFGDTTSVGMHFIFEAYVNFGPWGVWISMVLFGLALGRLESLYYKHALRDLYWEYCIILATWAICLYCDKMSFLFMTVIPGIFLCTLLRPLLRARINLRFHSPARSASPRPKGSAPFRPEVQDWPPVKAGH